MKHDKDNINDHISKQNSQFAFNIFREIIKEDVGENIFISPLSISTALTMTYQGAKGSTKEAMAETLGYTEMDNESLNEGYKNMLEYLAKLDNKIDLSISNSIWIRDGEPIDKKFISINKESYNALVSSLDFSKDESANTINKWIEEATKGKIDTMIEPPIDPLTIMYIINAIYFKGDWAKEFDKKETTLSNFYREDSTTQEVDMMFRKDTLEYGEGKDFKVVRLPYGNDKAAMYCILPYGETSINGFIMTLDKERWEHIKDTISEEDQVILQLPRFKFEYGIKSLKGSLTTLGMGDAFRDDANLTGIGENLFISDVIHKAIIDVNEKGSEAAAATVVDIGVNSIADPDPTFIANRPFVFIIQDDETGTILFMGKFEHAN